MICFGTGGWRAVIGDDFTRENIQRATAGILAYMKETDRTKLPVPVGYDRRFLSVAAAKWIAEVLTAGGVQVLFMPRSVPTPMIMHTVLDRKLWFGIEVTASHNPSEYNGIKLIVEEGRDAPLEVTNRIEELIEEVETIPRLPFEEAVRTGAVTYIKKPFDRFMDSIVSQLDMKALREDGPRVLFDCMHGSGVFPLQVIFHAAYCTIDTINENRDAFFGGKVPAPSENTLQTLKNEVLAGNYDLGLAMDGDGDRLGVIDANGAYVGANEILCMLYWYLHEYKGWRGPVVRNLATTHMLDRIAEDLGEVCYEVPVGFKYISSKIDEVDAVLGGESSGGLTVRGHIHGKDSIYASLLFAEMMAVTKRTPSEIMADFRARYGDYVMVEDNLRFTADCKAAIYKTVFEDKKLPDFGVEITRVNYEDGCKVYFADNSFVICRFSGTEPLLRIFAEGSSASVASGYISAFKQFLGL